MPRFGTSEGAIFGTGGRVQTKGETLEVCPTCEFSANGPTNFSIMDENVRTATLICTNCGDTKTVFASEVKRAPGSPRAVDAAYAVALEAAANARREAERVEREAQALARHKERAEVLARSEAFRARAKAKKAKVQAEAAKKPAKKQGKKPVKAKKAKKAKPT